MREMFKQYYIKLWDEFKNKKVDDKVIEAFNELDEMLWKYIHSLEKEVEELGLGLLDAENYINNMKDKKDEREDEELKPQGK